jgi:hypothetical protein
MGRNFSPFITDFFASRAAADARAYNAQFGLDITLRSGVPLRVGSKGGASIALAPALSFTGKIEQIPEIFLSQDETADGSGVFNIINLDYLLSALIPEPTRLLDKAECTPYVCLPKPDGTYEGVIMARGFLRLSEGDDQTATLSYVSDLSDRTVIADIRELTQRCLNVFAVIDPARRSWCGAALDPTVNPSTDTCTFVFDDEDGGCAFWGQQATFQGVSFFNPESVQGYGGPLDGGGGWDPTDGGGRIGGDCCDEEGWWLFADGIWRGGENVQEGEALIDHRGDIGIVSHVERVWAEYRYLLRSSSGTEAVITPTHPLILSMTDERGTAAMQTIGSKDKNLRVVDYATRPALSRFRLRPYPSGWVLRIHMTRPHMYIAGRRPGRGIAGHNEKPIYQINAT